MKKLIDREGFTDAFEVDSAGTINDFEGEFPDLRMCQHAGNRGLFLDSPVRMISEKDLKQFDYIVVMDEKNFYDLLKLDPEKRYAHKIFKMADYCPRSAVDEVPDPYMGEDDDFVRTLDILEEGCANFFQKVKDDVL
jgi:protein-tyrosine phosphatase